MPALPIKTGKDGGCRREAPSLPSSLLRDAGSVCNRPLNDSQPASALVTQLTTLSLGRPHSLGEHEEFVRTHYSFQDTGEPFSRQFTEWDPVPLKELIHLLRVTENMTDSSGLKGGHYRITYIIFLFFFFFSKQIDFF